MPGKPTANDVKKLVRRLAKTHGDNVDPAAVLRRVARDDAMLQVLAHGKEGVEASDLREVISAAADLLGVAETWALGKPSEAPAEPPRSDVPLADDPAVLSAHERVKVFVDGACKGNPGPSAVGIVVTTMEGATLFEEAHCIGRTTNNVAEYQALIAALRILLDNGAPEAFIFSDSALMVNQVRGRWKVKNFGLMPLISEAQALRRRLPLFRINHIPREENKRADEIAGLALKQARDAAAL